MPYRSANRLDATNASAPIRYMVRGMVYGIACRAIDGPGKPFCRGELQVANLERCLRRSPSFRGRRGQWRAYRKGQGARRSTAPRGSRLGESFAGPVQARSRRPPQES